ncbi:MAG TPA: trypsin-like peptidase domain-containing protein [Steroidobacteraceae bacterium]
MRNAHRILLAMLLAVPGTVVAQTDITPPPEQPQIAPLPTIESEESPAWTRTLERIANGVVAIQVDAVRAFDTEWNTSAQATGFVVDARRGLVLTNRHVVTSGPVNAQATFLNREEVQLFPVYRDPVHDFGFYRYDPAKLRFIKPAELPLFPEGAQVGREIRVVGNDAGEQLSILAGTLARLDRDAPNYGIGKYNDFNTFYLQAASSTSGGSSGSPVIDVKGRVVALNAGGSSGAASSFYLPLKRVQRALKLIQEGKPVGRGTLQTVFEYTPFDELRRLGLRPDTEREVRAAFSDLTGMLVVSEVQPGSPTEGVLQPGDILVRMNGRLVAEFDPLNELLDASVGGKVEIEAQRGGEPITVQLAVQDLHAITPARYIEFGEAVVHELSYQQARHFNTPVRGVYVANPGYVLGASAVPRGAVIQSVDGKPMNTLADFENMLAGLAHAERATVRYFTLDDPRGQQWRVIRMDRRWFPARACHRDDELGIWPCQPVADGPATDGLLPATTRFVSQDDARVDRVTHSLVLVNFDMPYSVAGVTERNYHGTGLIVDAARGLIVTDRNTVPVAVGDVRITFAGTIEIPGKVEFIHPLHNLAVVSYDPALIGKTPVRAAKLNPTPLRAGQDVWVVGLRSDHKVMSQATKVAAVDALEFPLSRTLQFRDSNLETVSLVNPPGDYDGVLVNRSGDVVALWSSFAYEAGRDLQQENRGVPAELVTEMIPAVTESRPLYSLEAEFQVVPLAAASKLGLSREWIERLEAHDAKRRQALAVARVVAGSPAASLLQPGDLVLAIDGQPVNRFREVERAVQKGSIRLTVWRDGVPLDLDVNTVPLDGRDIDRLLIWAGATLQAPHRAMAAQRGIAPEGVFVAYFYYGSPATRYGLYAGRRIVEVDGQPTPDLDSFMRVVLGREDRSSVRLKTVTWNSAVEVITLKLDRHYWPAYELRRSANGWVRTELE